MNFIGFAHRFRNILIAQRGFHAVAVEADWPDAYRVNCFVRGAAKTLDSVEALSGFERFPQWMWRNADVLDFVGWLREHNDEQEFEDRKCGFYGLDLYSLHASIEAVLAYLSKVDPEAAKRARHHYSCFEQFGKKIETYGYATGFGLTPTCEAGGRARTGRAAPEGHGISATRRSDGRRRLFLRGTKRARRPERRGILPQHVSARSFVLEPARHPHDGIVGCPGQVIWARRVRRPKSIVWAHNSHLGDARATQMGERGELNLGQLVREHFGKRSGLDWFHHL